ncbi:hypothetical protein ACVBEQ_27025 [Nakamurella sp. GG22]
MSMDLARTVNRLECRDDVYVTDRGEQGRVAGRTLVLEDRIAVILDAGNLLAPNPSPGRLLSFNSTGARYVKDTLIHEAQHVLIRQRGTYAYGELPAARGVASNFFRQCAVLVLDEYRAVAGARNCGTTSAVRARNVIEGLEVLDRSLDAAHSNYLTDRDLRTLRNQVCMFAQVFWVNSLAYFAGGRPADAVFPATMVRNALWQAYVGETWPPLEAILHRAPRSDARATDRSSDLLPTLVNELAKLLDLSLRQFGFAFEDSADGGSALWIL